MKKRETYAGPLWLISSRASLLKELAGYERRSRSHGADVVWETWSAERDLRCQKRGRALPGMLLTQSNLIVGYRPKSLSHPYTRILLLSAYQVCIMMSVLLSGGTTACARSILSTMSHRSGSACFPAIAVRAIVLPILFTSASTAGVEERHGSAPIGKGNRERRAVRPYAGWRKGGASSFVLKADAGPGTSAGRAVPIPSRYEQLYRLQVLRRSVQ